MIDAIIEDVERYYEIDIRTFDLRPHKIQSAQLAKKVIYFCILHRFEILEKMKKKKLTPQQRPEKENTLLKYP